MSKWTSDLKVAVLQIMLILEITIFTDGENFKNWVIQLPSLQMKSKDANRSGDLLRSRSSFAATFRTMALTFSPLVTWPHTPPCLSLCYAPGGHQLASHHETEPQVETPVKRGQYLPHSWPVEVVGLGTGMEWVSSVVGPSICREDEVRLLIHINYNPIWGRNWTCSQFCKEVSQSDYL